MQIAINIDNQKQKLFKKKAFPTRWRQMPMNMQYSIW